MDVDGAEQRLDRGAGVHQVEDGMDRLVAFDAEERRAEDLAAVGVGQHLEKALRLAALHRAADAGHRPAADQHPAAGGAGLGLGHAAAPERRVGEERVGRQAVGDLAVGAVQQVRGDDLVVVVGGVGERAAAIALAERPDAGGAGSEAVVDADEAAGVGLDPGGVEAEVVGVGPAAHRQEHVAARRLRRAVFAAEADLDIAAVRREADALRAGAHRDAVRLQDAADGLGDVRVLAADQARALLDHGDGGAEAVESLGELEADVAAADHDEVAGQRVEGEDRFVVERRHVVHPRQVGARRAGADVQEDARGRKLAVAYPERRGDWSGGRGR